jgi:hypothetical protein
VAQQVHAGQEIARVGMIGYTYVPLLHFHVFVFTGHNIWTDFDTLDVKFYLIFGRGTNVVMLFRLKFIQLFKYIAGISTILHVNNV